MNYARITLVLAFLLIHLMIGSWDLWCVAQGRVSDTVSRVIWEACTSFPILPFMLGIIVGHLLWPQRMVPVP